MLPGVGVPLLNMRRPILIPAATGTLFGNMTQNAGLTGAFDGNTNQNAGTCAVSAAAADGFVGKSFASPKIFHSATVHGSNDHGFIYANNSSFTLRIYGKKGAAPASAFDGTEVGHLNFTDTTNESAGRAISSADLITAWDHLWLAFFDGVSAESLCGELILNEYAG